VRDCLRKLARINHNLAKAKIPSSAAQKQQSAQALPRLPKLLSAWRFALRRFCKRNPQSYLNLSRSSRDTSAPPPENQRDYEQHKEYKEQEFCDTRRCRGDTAKSKNRCHKCDD
jgi:hypothetical protein